MQTTEATHRAGPWHTGGIDGHDLIVYGPDTMPIANAVTHHGRPREEMEANARLMAAAPDLLAALIEMASGHSMAGEARARVAIAKARG